MGYEDSQFLPRPLHFEVSTVNPSELYISLEGKSPEGFLKRDYLRKIESGVRDIVKAYTKTKYDNEYRFNVYSDGGGIRVIGGTYDIKEEDLAKIKEIAATLKME